MSSFPQLFIYFTYECTDTTLKVAGAKAAKEQVVTCAGYMSLILSLALNTVTVNMWFTAPFDPEALMHPWLRFS